LIGIEFHEGIGISLSFEDNRITSISPLPELIERGARGVNEVGVWIDLKGNPIKDYSPIRVLPSFTTVILDSKQYAEATRYQLGDTRIKVEERRDSSIMRSGPHPGRDVPWFRELQKVNGDVLKVPIQTGIE
jgi:hypothetical protein